jgi:hypothetical protein
VDRLAGSPRAVFHHPGSQECPNGFQNALVGYPCGDTGHKAIMVDSIKKFLEVKINHNVVALGNVGLRLR